MDAERVIPTKEQYNSSPFLYTKTWYLLTLSVLDLLLLLLLLLFQAYPQLLDVNAIHRNGLMKIKRTPYEVTCINQYFLMQTPV